MLRFGFTSQVRLAVWKSTEFLCLFNSTHHATKMELWDKWCFSDKFPFPKKTFLQVEKLRKWLRLASSGQWEDALKLLEEVEPDAKCIKETSTTGWWIQLYLVSTPCNLKHWKSYEICGCFQLDDSETMRTWQMRHLKWMTKKQIAMFYQTSKNTFVLGGFQACNLLIAGARFCPHHCRATWADFEFAWSLSEWWKK